MIIKFGENEVQLNIDQFATMLVEKYETLATEDIILPNGIKISIKRKSLARLALQAMCEYIVLPLVEEVYKYFNLELPKLERHADVLDYVVKVHHELLLKTQNKIIISPILEIENQTGTMLVTALNIEIKQDNTIIVEAGVNGNIPVIS